jgi:hypothetical protein
MKALRDAIETLLKGDTTLMALVNDVHEMAAPEEAPYPFIVMIVEGGPDADSMGGRLWTTCSVTLRAHTRQQLARFTTHAEADADTIEDAMARVDVLLTEALAVTGYTVKALRRVSVTPDQKDIVDNVIYRAVGGVWEVVIA